MWMRIATLSSISIALSNVNKIFPYDYTCSAPTPFWGTDASIIPLVSLNLDFRLDFHHPLAIN